VDNNGREAAMLDFFSKNWWVLVLRGVCAVLFGVVIFLWPVKSIAVLVLMWGAYAFADGILSIAGSFKGGRAAGFPWWLLITGIVGVAAGVFTFVNPVTTGLALLLLVAAFSIVRGVMQIAAAIRLRHEIEHEWLLAIAGIMSVVFGIWVAIFPGAGALAIVLWLGVMAVAIGVLEITAGLRLKGAGTPAAA
jgi:uncharacterized membrane protein HdeD (DUF308 family)